MKKFIVLFFLATFSTAFSQNWETNFTEAKSKAVKENKNIQFAFVDGLGQPEITKQFELIKSND